VEQHDLRKIVQIASEILNDSKSKLKVDLGKLKTVMINAANLHPRISENLMFQTVQILEFYGLDSASIVPIASLPEAGGVILSMRASDTKQDTSLDNLSITIDSEALTRNEIKLLGNEKANTIRYKSVTLCDSGSLVSQSQILIIDADDYRPCNSLTVGEVLVSGQHIPSQCWKLSEPIGLQLAGLEDTSWFKTGLLGFMYRERLFIVGAIADRYLIRDQRSEMAVHYAHDLIHTVETKLKAVKVW
jgi:acyl-CoA synthetase (AMP-forming)/AMP-acid ligase II